MGILRTFAFGTILALTMSVLSGFWSGLITGRDGEPFAGAAMARGHHRSGHAAGRSSKASKHHGSHHRGRRGHSVQTSAAKPKYAYALDFFMMKAPDFDQSLLPDELAQKVRSAFSCGTADIYPPHYLIRSQAVKYHGLRGGIFKRRERVKYIIVHSTETGVPQDACHVIEAWSSGGRRHPGTQYIVDRDGTIFQALHPDFGAVHVNIFKTLPGINNDNSIGIEMCHAGRQTYLPEQKASVIRLVAYLQDRYHVLNENIITHRYAQQGDHTDPVAFDWEGFLALKDDFREQAIALKQQYRQEDLAENDLPVASVYLEMHKFLDPDLVLRRKPLSIQALEAAQREIESLAFPAADASPAGQQSLSSAPVPPSPTAKASFRRNAPALSAGSASSAQVRSDAPPCPAQPADRAPGAAAQRPQMPPAGAAAASDSIALPPAPAKVSAPLPQATRAAKPLTRPGGTDLFPSLGPGLLPVIAPAYAAGRSTPVPLRGEIEIAPSAASVLRNQAKQSDDNGGTGAAAAAKTPGSSR